jgi:hypothetical protein
VLSFADKREAFQIWESCGKESNESDLRMQRLLENNLILLQRREDSPALIRLARANRRCPPLFMLRIGAVERTYLACHPFIARCQDN